MVKVFIDGQAGTTGLQIHERIQARNDLEIITIPDADRKNPKAKAEYLNNADIVFLCLPDAAAKESVGLINNSSTRVIDASTAHRTDNAWAYGLPELSSEYRQKLRESQFIANPGCHATGFNILVAPLVQEGLIKSDTDLVCHSLTGYSGGGKALIANYEENPPENLLAPRPYALGLSHKHLPEMKKVSGLNKAPLFLPVVGPYYKGMAVSVPILPSLLSKNASIKDLTDFYRSYYQEQQFIQIEDSLNQEVLDGGFLDPTVCNDTNEVRISVWGNSEQLLIFSRFDNLGKGASGAAVQNMNIALGLDESIGL
jgi:N-acetyl-gamma-glutamyl-phosphate reductase